MAPEVVELVAQLGVGGILLYLLMEERKARLALEVRVFNYLDERLEVAEKAVQPKVTAK